MTHLVDMSIAGVGAGLHPWPNVSLWQHVEWMPRGRGNYPSLITEGGRERYGEGKGDAGEIGGQGRGEFTKLDMGVGGGGRGVVL